jgi:hypothetical protein
VSQPPLAYQPVSQVYPIYQGSSVGTLQSQEQFRQQSIGNDTISVTGAAAIGVAAGAAATVLIGSIAFLRQKKTWKKTSVAQNGDDQGLSLGRRLSRGWDKASQDFFLHLLPRFKQIHEHFLKMSFEEVLANSELFIHEYYEALGTIRRIHGSTSTPEVKKSEVQSYFKKLRAGGKSEAVKLVLDYPNFDDAIGHLVTSNSKIAEQTLDFFDEFNKPLAALVKNIPIVVAKKEEIDALAVTTEEKRRRFSEWIDTEADDNIKPGKQNWLERAFPLR